MSNYTKTTDFEAKDSLPTGDSGKIIRGAEFETEFDAISTAIATKADTAGPTFTGTLTFETISDGTIGVTAFVDEDNMASNSATLVPTQQSVKAYVDSVTTELNAQDLDFQADSGGALNIDLDTETMTFTGGTGIDTSGSGNTVTFDIDSTVTTLTGTQTLTNKTLTAPVISGNLTTDGTIDGRDVATDGAKLDGIEAGATADQTDAEIRAAVEAATDSNVFTDADHTKLDGIEASATADQTDAEIRAAVEAATDSNVFTDADHTKLDGIEASATADQTDAEIRAAVEAATDSNVFTDADHTKLDGIEALADVTDTTNVTAAGALMDSELTNLTAVKSLDQGVATTDTPTFAGLTTTANVSFGDNDKAIFGAGSDLQIYHDGSNSWIHDGGTGNLNIEGRNIFIIGANTDTNLAGFIDGAEARLYYNGSQKLATTSTGIDVTGTATMDGLSVDGGNSIVLNAASTPDYLELRQDTATAIITAGNDSAGSGAMALQSTSGGTAYDRLGIASNGDISFYEDTGTTAKFFWDSSAESLGIGTSSPSAPLSVGSVSGDTYAVFDNGAKARLTFNGDASAFKIFATTTGFANYEDLEFRADNYLFKTGTTERMRIDSSGDVGIGVTSPDATLTVSSGSANNVANFKSTDGTAYIAIADNSSTSALHNQIGVIGDNMYFATDDTERMRIDSSGNVGIGTSSPVAVLDVIGGSGNDSFINSSSDAGVGINDIVGGLNAYSRDVGATSSGGVGGVYIKAATAFNTTYTPTYMAFHTHANIANDGSIFGNSSERMRIDSSGNLLVGTTSTAVSSSTGSVTGSVINNSGLFEAAKTGTVMELNRLTGDGTILNFRKDGSTVGSIGSYEGTHLRIGSGTANVLFVNDTGILPSTNSGAASNGLLDLGDSGRRFKDLYLSNKVHLQYPGNSYYGRVQIDSSNNLIFGTGPSGLERMRLDSSGNLLVGHTAVPSSGSGGSAFVSDSFDRNFLKLSTSATTSIGLVEFDNPNGIVGKISTSGSSTIYATSSDQRLKDNIVDAPSASDDIDAIQVRSFDWKADGSHQKYGMVAQELNTVAPEAVSEGETEEDMMGVDYSKLVPMMLKEIQSLRARVAQLEGEA